MDVYDVVARLIGEINPVGETHTDNIRYDNLKEVTGLIEQLLNDIHAIKSAYENSPEFSVKRASDYCGDFLEANGFNEKT